LSGSASAKTISGEAMLSNRTGENWKYLTKFSYGQGTGNFTLDVKPVEVGQILFDHVSPYSRSGSRVPYHLDIVPPKVHCGVSWSVHVGVAPVLPRFACGMA
jgi:hypothetical protein